MEDPIVFYEGEKGSEPAYQSDGAAGADLRANIGNEVVIKPGGRALIPTGIRLQIPRGMEAQVRPRSGLAARHGVTVLNSPGTIDSDYRGEVMVILINLGAEDFRILPGDRIAQVVFSPVARVSFMWSDRVKESRRGNGGFGSTGI
jgi:dUTP pyrophosphatase